MATPYTIKLTKPEDTAEAIAEKLNHLYGAIEHDVIKDGISKTEVLNQIASLKELIISGLDTNQKTNNKHIEAIYSREGTRNKLTDQRWHGGGVSRSTKIIASITSSANPTINTDIGNMFIITAQALDIASFTTNLGGSPVAGQTLWIAVTGTNTFNITWGNSFESSATATLPTTGAITTTRSDIAFVYNDVTKKWRCIAIA